MVKLRKFVLAWTENGPDGDKLHGESCFTLDEIIHGIHLENCSPSRGYIPAGIREFTGVCDTSYSTWRFSPEANGRDYRIEVVKG